MRTITGLVVGAAFCCLAGCATPPPPAGPDVDSGGWSWYEFKEVNAGAEEVGVSVSWGSWDKKFVYVLLTDTATTTTTRISTAGARREFQVGLKAPGGRKAELRIETADGKSGSVVCGGRSFDLAQGSIFILLPRGEVFQVEQIKRDLSDVRAGVGSAYQLLRDDPEVGRYFTKVE